MQALFLSHIKKGILIAVIIGLYKIVLHLNQQYFNDTLIYAGWSVFIFLVITSVILFKQATTEALSFGGYFAHGFKTTAVATSIIFVLMVLLFYVIFPNLFDKPLQEMAAEATKNPVLGKDFDAAMAKKVFRLMYLSKALMGNLLLGVIGSLFGAGVSFGLKFKVYIV